MRIKMNEKLSLRGFLYFFTFQEAFSTEKFKVNFSIVKL